MILGSPPRMKTVSIFGVVRNESDFAVGLSLVHSNVF
jgi:hypothetical protein